jgi:hypothetical protein
LLPASCLSTSAFFLHFPAKFFNFSRQKLSTNQLITNTCVFQHSRQNFKIFPPKLSSNLINHLQFNYFISAYFLHSRKNLKFSPAKTQIQIQSINYSLTIPSLPFTCVRDEISNFLSKTKYQPVIY